VRGFGSRNEVLRCRCRVLGLWVKENAGAAIIRGKYGQVEVYSATPCSHSLPMQFTNPPTFYLPLLSLILFLCRDRDCLYYHLIALATLPLEFLTTQL